MTIQDELAALPRNPKYPIRHPDDVEPYRTNRILRHVMDERDALAAHLVLAERLLRAVLDSGLEPGGRDYGMVAVKITDYNDARAYLAWREAE